MFDEQKLLWMNGLYIRSKSEKELYDTVIEILHSAEIDYERLNSDYILEFIYLMKDRVRTINEFATKGIYFFT